MIRLIAGLFSLIGVGGGCAGAQKPSPKQLATENTAQWASETKYTYMGECISHYEFARDAAELKSMSPAIERWINTAKEGQNCEKLSSRRSVTGDHLRAGYVVHVVGLSKSLQTMLPCIDRTNGEDGYMGVVSVDISNARFICDK